MEPALREVAGPSAVDDNPGQTPMNVLATVNTQAVGSSTSLPSIDDHPGKLYIEISLERICDMLVNVPQR